MIFGVIYGEFCFLTRGCEGFTTMWGLQTIAKLVYNSNNYGNYDTCNIFFHYRIHGVYKPTFTSRAGGPHIVLI